MKNKISPTKVQIGITLLIIFSLIWVVIYVMQRHIDHIDVLRREVAGLADIEGQEALAKFHADELPELNNTIVWDNNSSMVIWDMNSVESPDINWTFANSPIWEPDPNIGISNSDLEPNIVNEFQFESVKYPISISQDGNVFRIQYNDKYVSLVFEDDGSLLISSVEDVASTLEVVRE